MPQSTKDSRGGKTRGSDKTKSHSGSAPDAKKASRNANSPIGPMTKGEKKTTPKPS